jgi:hypothetical protein
MLKEKTKGEQTPFNRYVKMLAETATAIEERRTDKMQQRLRQEHDVIRADVIPDLCSRLRLHSLWSEDFVRRSIPAYTESRAIM